MPKHKTTDARPKAAQEQMPNIPVDVDDDGVLLSTTENRAAALRWLAQGEGLNRDKLWVLTYMDGGPELFGAKLVDMADGTGGARAVDDLEALILSAYNTLVRSEFRDAIGNALGIDYDGPDELRGSLSDRRDHYRLKHGMSPRTVIRHEDKGALLLAKQIEQTPLTTGFKRVVLRKMIEELSNAEIKALITSIPRLNDVVREMCAETDV